MDREEAQACSSWHKTIDDYLIAGVIITPTVFEGVAFKRFDPMSAHACLMTN